MLINFSLDNKIEYIPMSFLRERMADLDIIYVKRATAAFDPVIWAKTHDRTLTLIEPERGLDINAWLDDNLGGSGVRVKESHSPVRFL